MIRCRSCGTDNLDSSQYCDECGERLAVRIEPQPGISTGSQPNGSADSGPRPAHITSVGIPPLVDRPELDRKGPAADGSRPHFGNHSRLVIERGDFVNTEFLLSGEESNIGRWDADNGIFPDVDLDAHDPDAKVSRRHARIVHRDNIFTIEDLGSTNGTFLNRGRRLLPGSPQILNEGDEIIVGKTFLRFHISSR